VHVEWDLAAERSDEPAARLSQSVDPETILARVDLGAQAREQLFELPSVQGAFEHGLLHTLTVTLAKGSHTPEPSSSGRSVGGDVVGYEILHGDQR
jgi:hypothetical protein